MKRVILLVCLCLATQHVFATSLNATWQGDMRVMESQLLQLLVDVSSDQRFNNPDNFDRIEQNAAHMAKLARQLQDTTHTTLTPGDLPSEDPTLPLISELFTQEMDHAVAALKAGHRSYARSKLLSTTGYCMGCHTRNDKGPRYVDNYTIPGLDALTPIERASLYTASRQYDKALYTYHKIIRSKPGTGFHQLEWEHALRNALILAVRVEQSPTEAMRIVQRALKSRNLSRSMRADAVHWKEAILEWRKNAKQPASFAAARALFDAAIAEQSYLNDRRSDIEFLRVTNMLHTLLQQNPKAPERREALFMLGRSYESLRDLELWTLHELYYETCIRETPHSNVAQRCFTRLEDSMQADYTGSSGVDLPRAMRRKLNELRKLAK